MPQACSFHVRRRAAIVALAVLVVVSPSAFAQDTRAGQIASQQAEKSKRLSAEEAGTGEKFVVRVLGSPLLTGTGGVYPWFGSVYPGSGFAAGLGYLRRLPNSGAVSLTAAGSIRGSYMGDADWRIPVPERTRLRPRLNARWTSVKKLGFYGVGPESDIDDKTQFDYEPKRVQAVLDAPVLDWLTLSGSYGYLDIGTSADLETAPASPMVGLGESIQFLTSGAGVTADWRTSPGYSTSGGMVRLGWNRYNARDDAPYTFDTTEFEAVQLVPLLREQYVLAFHVLATATDTSGNNDIPFPLLPTVGGGDTVRGLANRRLTDKSRAVATAEYRWRPSRYVDMAIFLDAGTVGPSFRDLSDEDIQTAWGIGARLHGPNFSALRIEAARGREGWRFIFASGQPF